MIEHGRLLRKALHQATDVDHGRRGIDGSIQSTAEDLSNLTWLN